MEDKWLWLIEADTPYANRSHTGICVYRIDFSFSDNLHKVTYNLDLRQVRIKSAEQSQRDLNDLLSLLSQTEYDPYGEVGF